MEWKELSKREMVSGSFDINSIHLKSKLLNSFIRVSIY